MRGSNEVLCQLKERKSVRVFSGRPVGKEKQRLILQAAAEAPTAGNQQLYSILRITDPELKRALSVACDNQPFIATAPLVLIFVADCLFWRDFYRLCGASPRKPEAGDLMLAVTDACIAAQNTVVAAHSLGLGSCYIGDIMENCEQIRTLLDLPDYTFPCAMLVFGYPAKSQLKRKKPERFRLDDTVFENRYVPRDPETLRKMFSAKIPANVDPDKWGTAFCERKYDSAFSVEMQRSVRKYLDQYS